MKKPEPGSEDRRAYVNRDGQTTMLTQAQIEAAQKKKKAG